jgi:hypothetical protein
MNLHVSVTVTATPPTTVGFVPILMPWCSCPPLAAVAGEPPPTYSPGALEEHVREVRADGLQGPLPGTSVVVIVRAQWLAPAPSPPGPPPAAPTNTVAPAITGLPAVGQLLTVSNGTWTGTPLVFNYQWKANGTNVGSAVNTYTPTSADIGKTITCTVTAVNAGGSTPATSAGVGPVTPAAPVTGSISSGTTGNMVVALPSNASGDTLAVWVFNTIGTPVGTPSGWTLRATQTQEGGDRVTNLFTRVSPGGLASVTFTDVGQAIWRAIATNTFSRGFNASASATNNTPNTAPVAPTVTGTGSNRVLLSVYFANAAVGGSISALQSGQTSLVNQTGLWSARAGYELAGAGATGTRTATVTVNTYWTAFNVLFG